MLQVGVLGELTVEVDGRAVELPRAWRSHLVLAWLALHPGTHRRAVVAGRFWPDVVDDRARAGRWEDAVALCRGELLAGVEEDWVADPREAHRRRLAVALEALARQAETAGDLPRAVALSRRRAELDALDDDAHAALIGRLAAAGDVAGALVCFERHREALERELAIAPSPATRRLADCLRAAPARMDPAAPAARDLPAGAPPSWEPARPFPLPPRLRLPLCSRAPHRRTRSPPCSRSARRSVISRGWPRRARCPESSVRASATSRA